MIDPGPDDAGHLDAIAGCGGDRIRWIVCTHTHPDHSPGVAGLKARTGAEVRAFDARDGLDDRRADGRRRRDRGHRVRAPRRAHARATRRTTSASCSSRSGCCSPATTSWTAPPWSSARPTATWPSTSSRSSGSAGLRPRLRAIAPGHGHLIEDPIARIDGYLAHRVEREAQVLAKVRADGPITIPEIVAELYADVREELHEVAAKSVWAHLRKLARRGARCKGDRESPDGPWRKR